MQRKFTQLLRLLLIIFAFGITQNANAQIQHEDSPVEVYVGETVQVPIGSVYSSTLSRSTNVSYNWTCQGGLQIASGTRDYAYITGVTATTSGKLYFQCSYKYNGYFRTMNFYWDIVVKDNTVYVTKVEVTPSSATMIVGEKLKLTDNIYPTNATEQGVRWYSSAPNTVQVWESGLAEALSPGLATITCYAIDGSGEYATCDITVIPAEPTAVNITTEETSISVGETLKLGYAITPAGATTEVEWESDNTAVATVSDEGVITAIGIGEANITVTTANGLTDSYHITVTETPTIVEPTAVNITTEETTIEVGNTLKLDYSITPAGATTEVEWESDNTAVATVSDEGVITAIGIGEANITVTTANGLTDSYHITITAATSGGIPVNGKFEVDGIYYEVIDSVAKAVAVINKGSNSGDYTNEYSGTINIPERVTYLDVVYSVTSIADFAFNNYNKLKSVNIPNSVTKIGASAFYNCDSLNSITIPNSVITIGQSTFYGCASLTSVIIPNSVDSIGFGLFDGCTNLASVTIPPSITTIPNGMFSNCANLIFAIPETVTKIGDLAFSDCTSLTKVTIPNSVTEIGSCAFLHCSSITDVTLPNTITSIKSRVFEECTNLNKIAIPNSVTEIGQSAFEDCTALDSVCIPESVTSIGSYAFKNTPWYEKKSNGVVYIGSILYNYKGTMPNNTTIAIKEGTTKVSPCAFYYCEGLTSISIPNSVTEISHYAFAGCTNLTSIILPNSINSINEYTFYGCTKLTDVTIPNSVTLIDFGAFQKCTGLTSISIPNSVTVIGPWAFSACTSLTEFIVPSSVTSFSANALENCPNLSKIEVEESNEFYDSRDNCNAIIRTFSNTLAAGCKSTTIPNSVTVIGSHAFSGSSQLTTIEIPNSVTKIENGAFKGCSGLTHIDIPNSVTRIENYSFYDCAGLASVSLGNAITKIDYDAFAYCTSLTEISIPNSVNILGSHAFYNCSSLSKLDLGNSVTQIETEAFYNCIGLTKVSIPNSVTTIGDNTFLLCSNLTEIDIPNSVKSIGVSAFRNTGWYNNQLAGVLYLDSCCLGYKGSPALSDTLLIKDGIYLIGELAFENCNFAHISISNSVVYIGNLAFKNCYNLSSVSIGCSVASIGHNAFRYCPNLTEITSLNPTPPECGGYCFEDVPTTCVLKVPAGSKELYAEAEGWSQFINIVEIASVGVSTQENNATFAIPTTEGAATYTVNVYSDEAMTQLVATTDYYEPGRIVPMSTSLELSIDGFDIGTYYYDVIVKSETGETLGNYTGTFEIETNGVEEITQGNDATEVARYDIHGRPLAKPTKGVNIVVFSDGTTRKEVVR